MKEMVVESVRLLFAQGSSDKEYRVQLVEVDGGHVVNFQYGRRDGPLKAGSKTGSPLDLESARKVYSKLIGSKTSEGYTTAEGGVAYQGGSNEERISGLLPQLLNPLEETELESFLLDDRVFAQQKYDGERRMVRAIAGQAVHGVNRKGLIVPLPVPIAEAFGVMTCVVDGELVGDTLHAFDLLELDGLELRGEGALARVLVLERVGAAFGPAVKIVSTAQGSRAKRDLLASVKALGQEGIVFKHVDASYEPGRPNSGGNQRKFKLVESATVRVRAINGSKRSVELEMSASQADGSVAMVRVGSVTIPANHAIPAVGQICEVSYLYAYEQPGSLFQPVYKGVRGDLDVGNPTTISIAQLKFKRKHEDAMAA